MSLPLGTLLLAVAALAPARQDVDVPANDGWVTDLAGVLDDEQERSLEALMESYKRGAGHDIALLTIPSLEGESLERYALEVARNWGLGSEETNDGALLLVAVAERKMRIEVGRGLEGTLTDAISGRIIRDVIAPRFREQGYYEGILAGVRAMHAAIGGDYGPLEASRGARQRGGGAGALAVFGILALIGLASSVGRYRYYRSAGGGDSFLPWLLLMAMSSRGGGSWSSGSRGGFGGGGGFSGFGGGGGFSGGGASGGW